jgi:dihydrofolate synthase/folylpolyglutamate synthase
MEYIESCAAYGIVPGLDSIRELLKRLGDPQKKLQFVHVAGTNGKGSVCTFVASVLKCAGYKVGRYLSPTIFTYRERIQVNDKNISVRALCAGVERIKKICDEMTAEGLAHPTPFEIETALGFLYFVEKKCDIVVLETGMGGALDATNIVENTLVAVLTPISMDHMQFLGKTLGEIAAQKAGILKRGCTAVSAQQAPEAQEVILKKSKELDCAIQICRKDDIFGVKYGLEKQRFSYGEQEKLEITLAGRYQIENAALAVEVLQALSEKGFAVSQEKLRQGLREAKWAGRFSIIAKKPLFIVDGAHNEDAAKRLAESIEFYFTNKRIIYIMGVLRDKEYEKLIAQTHCFADQIITLTPPGNPRALAAYDLACEVAKVHRNVTAVDSLEDAVEMSLLLAGKEDVIIAFGSLSYLGRLMEIVAEKKVR